ncbi:MAG: PKD domain-containing protein [Lunatimonas sp.]|uniref:PKD domain-containing protein n=1 Tax=Lunatimonas sp. TaxID=2060141 RepID=UPI00263A8F67|nr:PKD domain-containing protein [Lunatimonas sp.]MCC5938666.1 PKD domain-containing protein [Lunatimonas sp.]
MKNILSYIWLLLPLLVVAGCVEEYRLEGAAPTEADANFSFTPTAESDNILRFTADGDFFMMNWDLGNGQTGEGKTVTGTYPLAGTYTVSLTVFNAGGSVTFSRDIVIDETDPLLLDRPIFNMLTGGVDATEGKTWKIDAGRPGHFGVGPNPSSSAGDFPEWYQAVANEKEGSGMYTDRYTFFLDGFRFVMETNGLVYLNAAQGSNFPGAFDPGVGDLSAPYEAPDGLRWSLVEPEGGRPELTISPGGFLGYFAGGRTYQIIRLEENEMFLRFVDQANTDLAWYIRLIPEGFEPDPLPEPEPEPENPDVSFSLNDLIGNGRKVWMLNPAAGAFGVGPSRGSDAFFPNGQDISGDRPCLFNDLFIFSSNGNYEYNAQGEVFGEEYMGIAEGCQPEGDLQGTVGAAWASGLHSYTFTPGTPTEYPKITVTGTGAFIALPKAYNGGEYNQGPPRENESVTYEVIGYDAATGQLSLAIDISPDGSVFWNFVLVPAADQSLGLAEFTRNMLVGSGEKAWKLKPAAGAFGVGPVPGSDEWFPSGNDISGDRPCLFNDRFIFNDNGTYTYDPQGDVFGEAYMGIDDGCQPVEALQGTVGEAWGGGSHQFNFTPASGGANAKLSVTGTGAFIALAKAYNGSEYQSGPPRPNETVTYDVLGYNANTQELTLTIDISGEGGVFWSFVLIPAND